MASTKEIRFRKLKKNRLALSLILLICTTMVAHILLALFVSSLLFHLTEQKLESEHAEVRHMAALYEKAATSGDNQIKSFLDENYTYLIMSPKGVVLDINGTNTCDTNGNVITIPGATEDDTMVIYPDREIRFLVPEDDDSFQLEYSKLIDWLTENNHLRTSGWRLGIQNAKLPLWMAVPVTGGRILIGKTTFEIYVRDILLLIIFAASIAFLIFVVLMIMIANIIKGVKRQRKMTAIFFMDDVTELHNWMWFHMRGDQIMSHRKNASRQFAILDVVFMNYRNFCVCHSVAEGEEMLCRVHAAIERSLHKNEISAHYASANFAVLLQYKAQSELKNRIENLIRDLEAVDDTHTFSFHVGVDLLEASVDKAGRTTRRRNVDVEKEYNNACAARATLSDQEESAIAFFNDNLVEEQRWMDQVREHQETALANEEFVVYYQPKYDPRSQKLCGAEALVRWDSKDLGFVPPGKFIPIFEKNGFITQIDHYMISHVAKDQRAWMDAGLPCVPISVNVSRAHFIEHDLAEQIRDLIDAQNCPHHLIEIELTESAFFDDKKAMIETIGRLKRYGFSVSMDDFGSGYSSLNSLKDMPLDVLKLDADFFRGEDGTGRGQIVVSEAIQLAKNLKMRTVAEGVEVKEQVDFLADLGCDMIQGFYFAKPMPKDEYVKRMQNGVPAEDALSAASVPDNA